MYSTHDHNTETTMPQKAMKLVVLGATGATGKHFIQHALDQGHCITAVVRNPSALGIKHENLTVAKCDTDTVTTREKLTPLFAGQDAVISCLGHSPYPKFLFPWDRYTLLADSARAIVPAMRMAKVNRLVGLSSWYLDTKAKDLPFYQKWIRFPFFVGKMIDDHREMEAYYERECPDINYTMIRLPSLLNGPVTDLPIKVVDDGAMYVPKVYAINRADVARFMLSCLGSDRWDHKSPAIGTH